VVWKSSTSTRRLGEILLFGDSLGCDSQEAKALDRFCDLFLRAGDADLDEIPEKLPMRHASTF